MSSQNGNLIQPQLPKLNNRNYHQWSIQMRVLYESQDLWHIVETGIRELPADANPQQTIEFRENKKKDKKALFFIYQAVDDAIFERISTASTSKEAWDMLHVTFRGEERVKTIRLQTLRCELDNIRMKESESIEEFYNRVISLINQMRVNGEPLEAKRIVEKILRSLTRRFEYVVVAIEESNDLSSLSLERLLGTLQSRELRLKQFDSPQVDQAFQTQASSRTNSNDKGKSKLVWKGKWQGKGRGRGYNKDHGQDNSGEGTSKGRGRGRPLSQTQCYHCQGYGHTIKFCRRKQAEENRDSTFMHEGESKEPEIMFMTHDDQVNISDEIWYLDSACSNHMTENKQMFVTLDEKPRSEVRTGDERKHEV